MDDLTKRLAAEYNLNALREEAEAFRRPVDREKYRMISDRYGQIVREQVRIYERDLDKRLVMAGKQIAKRNGIDFDKLVKAKDFKSRRRIKALKRLANRDVQSDHLRRIAVLRNREAQELHTLVDTVRQREAQTDAPKQPIKLLTDGRDAPDRQVFKPKL